MDAVNTLLNSIEHISIASLSLQDDDFAFAPALPNSSFAAAFLRLALPHFLETLYLSSIPGMKEKIVEGLNTPLDECVPEDKVSW